MAETINPEEKNTTLSCFHHIASYLTEKIVQFEINFEICIGKPLKIFSLDKNRSELKRLYL